MNHSFRLPPNTARYDKLVSLVERMLELHKRSPWLPQEQEMVKRVLGKPPRIIKIEPSADGMIDRLVDELSHKGMIYGLSEDEMWGRLMVTEDEVKVAEGS